MLIEDLEAFIAVVDCRSLVRAADQLSLTQSAISRRLQQLEAALGAELLNRSTKPHGVSAVGRRVYEQGVRLLRERDGLLAITQDDAEPTGTFRIGLPQALAEIAMLEAVVEIKRQFASLNIELQTDWSPRLLERVRQGELDSAALLMTSPGEQPEDLGGNVIAHLDVVVVQSRTAPLVARRTDIDALAAEKWILNPLGCGYRAALQRAMEGKGRELQISVDTHGTEMQLRLVAAGIGLGLVPRGVVEVSAVRKDLLIVDVADFLLGVDVRIVHALHRGSLRRPVEVFEETLFKCFSSPAGNKKASRSRNRTSSQ